MGVKNVNTNTYLYKIETFCTKKCSYKSVHHTLNYLIFTGKISAHSSKFNLIDLLGHNLFDYYNIFPMLVPS